MGDMIWGLVPEVLRVFLDSNYLKEYNEHMKSKRDYKEPLEIAIQNMKNACARRDQVDALVHEDARARPARGGASKKSSPA